MKGDREMAMGDLLNDREVLILSWALSDLGDKWASWEQNLPGEAPGNTSEITDLLVKVGAPKETWDEETEPPRPASTHWDSENGYGANEPDRS